MASAFNHVFGNLALTTVDAAGSPAPRTATIHGAAPISTSTQGFPDNVLLDGLILESTQGDGAYIVTPGAITIRNTTANNPGNGTSTDGTGDDGFDLTATGSNPVTIEDSEAEGAHGDLGDGFQIITHGGATIRNTQATNNSGTQDNVGVNIPDSLGDIVLDNIVANGNSEQGVYVYTTGAITLSGEANDNGYYGADLFTELGPASATGVSGTQQGSPAITVQQFTALRNADGGLRAQATGGVIVRDSQTNENAGAGMTLLTQESVEVTNTHLEDNGDQGLYSEAATGVRIDRVSAIDNGHGSTGTQAGLQITGFGAELSSVSVQNSLVQDNTGQGIDLFNLSSSGSHDIGSNVICGNVAGGLRNNGTVLTVPAEGNWWGDASGPTSPQNSGGTGDKVNSGGDGTIDFDPWISQVEAEQPSAAVVAGTPAAVAFKFSDDTSALFLDDGPGDDLGPAPFMVTTDNGVLAFGNETAQSVPGSIMDGQLEVSLTASEEGSANVSLTGPCGLSGQISVSVEVVTGTERLWGDIDCDGEITTRDNQGLLRKVLSQQALSQTEPCPDIGVEVSVSVLDVLLPGSHQFGNLDCDEGITTRDNQALLRKVLSQAALSQTEPCPDIGTSAGIDETGG